MLVSSVFGALIIMGILGTGAGIGLAIVSQRFRVDRDARIDRVAELLPGANCGACGFAGCEGLAEACVRGDVLPNVCALVSGEKLAGIAAVLGIAAGKRAPMVARIVCRGATEADRFVYDGIGECRAAALLQGGARRCAYGCIGLGSCVRACPFEAIRIGASRTPEIDETRCVGCGKCVQECPRGTLVLAPVGQEICVRCRNRDRGALVRLVCKNGCIACKKCERTCEKGAIRVMDMLAQIAYETCASCGKCADACPTGALGRAKAPEFFKAIEEQPRIPAGT